MEAPSENGPLVNGGAEGGGEGVRVTSSSEAPPSHRPSAVAFEEVESAAPAASGTAEGEASPGGENGFSDHAFLQPAPAQSTATLSVKEYLDAYVVPSLLPALAAVVEEKPQRPVEYLAHFLLDRLSSS